MNSLLQKSSGLLIVHDKYEPLNRQKIPMIDTLCFDNEDAIGRHISSKTTPLTLDSLRQNHREIRDIAMRCSRSRAYVMVGLSEYKSPMGKGLFAKYLNYFYKELDFCGFDVCFVQVIFNNTEALGEKRQPGTWGTRYQEVFGDKFIYEKLKIVLDYKNDIYSIPKKSYINLWETISEDYKEWCDV